MVKSRKTAYLVYGITLTGHKDILGIWIGEGESAKFWMMVLSDLKARGVADILIACVDGLAGFEKAAYDYILCDSQNEYGFAEKFEQNSDIKLYAKHPDNFKIPTPLGSYNPDWAVLIDKDGREKLYFIIETKANIDSSQFRASEWDKIRCGRKHFEALNTGITFKPVSNFEDFMDEI